MKSNQKGALQQIGESAIAPPSVEDSGRPASDTHVDPVARFYDILNSTEELVSASPEPDWDGLEERITRALVEVLPSVPTSEVASEFAYELVTRVRGEWYESAIGALSSQHKSLAANLRRMTALEPYEAAKDAVVKCVLELRAVNEAAGVFMTRTDTIWDHLHQIRRVAEEVPRGGRWLNKPPKDDEAWARMFDDMVYDSKCWPGRRGRRRKASLTP
jgi:hypothetical protein